MRVLPEGGRRATTAVRVRRAGIEPRVYSRPVQPLRPTFRDLVQSKRFYPQGWPPARRAAGRDTALKPPNFEYIRAETVESAVDALATGEATKVLAGGQSLVPLMNFRLSHPSRLVDINPVSELAQIREDGGVIRLGALVRHQTLVETPPRPLLGEAAAHIGHWAIRNRGTLGGSLCHADPAAEWPAVMVALGAEFTVQSRRGVRKVAARDFFQGMFTLDLAEDELLVEAAIPADDERRWGFYEVSRRAGDFALAGAVAAVAGDEGEWTWFGIQGTPYRRRGDGIPAREDERREWLTALLAGVEWMDEDPGYRKALAITVAERAYRRAREAV